MSNNETDQQERESKAGRNGGNKFQHGHPKYGGRKKGVPTRQTWLAREIAEQNGFNPVQVAIEVIMQGRLPAIVGKPGRDVSDEERLKMLRDLLSYLVPKLSAVQVTGNDGGPLAMASLDITKLMQDPELAVAAERLAIAIATGGNPPRTESFDDKSGAAIDIRRRPD
jgi:hypothetical protein